MEDKDKGPENTEENYPLSVHLNSYTFQQIVVTRNEIRMYDILTGVLYTILPRVFRQEEDDVEISAFKIDKRHRKAYISNNKGQIYVINSQNGVIVKKVTQYNDDHKDLKAFKENHMNDTITSLGSSRYESEDSNPDVYNDEVKPKKTKKKERPDSPVLSEAGKDDGEY